MLNICKKIKSSSYIIIRTINNLITLPNVESINYLTRKMGQVIRGPELNRKFDNSKTLGQLFIETAKKYPDRICHIDAFRDEKENYSSVMTRSIRLAIELQTLGTTSKNVILNCTTNKNDAIIPVIAAWLTGNQIANFDPIFTDNHTIYLMSLIKPTIIFIEDIYLIKMEKCMGALSIQPTIIVIGSADNKYKTFSELVATPKPNEENFQPFSSNVNETASMFFTSGSSGLPKAVCHSHKNLVEIANIFSNSNIQKSKLLHFASLYWITATVFMVSIFLEGGTRVFTKNLNVEHCFQIIQRYNIESMGCSPKITYDFTTFNTTYNVSSVKLILTGGNPISIPQLAKLGKLFYNACILFCYGMTEAGNVSSFNPKTDRDLVLKKPNSVGRPNPGVAMKIIDIETKQMLGPNQKGEIYVKSPSLMLGYYQMDSSNEFDAEGYFKTGDVGYFDEDNCLYVVDRVKEMFKYLGHHIVPAKLETLLIEHPGVSDVMVFGTPDKNRPDLQLPTACIVRKNGVELSEQQIHDFIDGKVSDWERLRGGIIFCEELPRGPSGKLQRRQIIAKYINYFDKKSV